MARTRRIPFITLSEYAPRAWITISGCNFSCRGCFSVAKKEVGTPMTPGELTGLVSSSSERIYGTDALDEVIITGGEPALDADYLLELVRMLRPICGRVTVQTNASNLTPRTTDALVGSGMAGLVVDIKALDRDKHILYTGHSNESVLSNVAYASSRISMVVNTLLIPGLVEVPDICAIARFISECDPMDLEYRINPFRADLSPERLSRTPDDMEVERAAEAARHYYHRTVSSRSCLKEAQGGRSRSWLTVLPNGQMERRGLADYRRKNAEMFKDGIGP